MKVGNPSVSTYCSWVQYSPQLHKTFIGGAHPISTQRYEFRDYVTIGGSMLKVGELPRALGHCNATTRGGEH
jgi:hypothetical protein